MQNQEQHNRANNLSAEARSKGGQNSPGNFKHDPERAAEGPAYLDWFRARGYPVVHEPQRVNEGEGDIVLAGRELINLSEVYATAKTDSVELRHEIEWRPP